MFWWVLWSLHGATRGGQVMRIWAFRGSKSRNKVSVGEPAEGSFVVKRKKSREQPARAVHCTALSIHFLTLVEITFGTHLSFSKFKNKSKQNKITTTNRLKKTKKPKYQQPATTDILALATMKNAAKCDT
jgi:hypothetical protein